MTLKTKIKVFWIKEVIIITNRKKLFKEIVIIYKKLLINYFRLPLNVFFFQVTLHLYNQTIKEGQLCHMTMILENVLETMMKAVKNC